KIAVADLDGDGRPDLAVANYASANVTLLRNQGGGSVATFPGSPITVGTSPQAIAAADLDGDGRPDLAVANFGSDIVTLLRNQGGGGFAAFPGSPITVGTSPSAITAADLDGDGRPDLAVTNFGSNDVTLLRNLGGGSF